MTDALDDSRYEWRRPPTSFASNPAFARRTCWWWGRERTHVGPCRPGARGAARQKSSMKEERQAIGAARGSADAPPRAEIERLLSLEHPDPHHVLGAHPVGGGVAVRVFRPDAEAVTVIPGRGARSRLPASTGPDSSRVFSPAAVSRSGTCSRYVCAAAMP